MISAPVKMNVTTVAGGDYPGQTLIGESMLFLEGMYAAEMLIVTESERLLFSTSQVFQICNSLGDTEAEQMLSD